MADKEPVAVRPEAAEEEEDASAATAAAGEEEDTGAQVAPIVRLEEVAVTTGEEDEDVLLDMSDAPLSPPLVLGARDCPRLVSIRS